MRAALLQHLQDLVGDLLDEAGVSEAPPEFTLEAPRNPELLASLTRHHRDCERRLARIIERLDAAGLGRSDDPAGDARMLTALVDGMAVQHHAIGLVSRAEADRVVYTAAEQRLGLAPGTLERSRPTPARGRWAVNDIA